MYQVRAGRAQELTEGLIPRRALYGGTRCPQAARQQEENCRAQVGRSAELKARAIEESE